MSCWLCGHESETSHHLGCVRALNPGLKPWQAAEEGLIPPPELPEDPIPDEVEVLREGSMTTVKPGTCAFPQCDKPKKSDHPRVKYCEVHADPKNRKE